MRVAVAIPAFLPALDYGGPVQKIRRLAPALRDLGVELTVITSTLARLGDNTLVPGPDVIENIPVQRLPTPWAYRFSPWVRWTGVAQYDVLHVIGAWNGLSYSALLAGKRVARTVLWEPVGMLVAQGRHVQLKSRLARAHELLAHRTQGLIWTSRREHEEAGILPAQRSFFRPNPCDPFDPRSLPDKASARRVLGIAGEGPHWGYLGRVDRRKGIDRLLTAWPGSGAGTLHIAGPVGDMALAREIGGKGPSVQRHQEMSGLEKWLYLRALDALILVPDYGENFGNVVIEAMQVGTPVLASHAVGALDWINDPGVRRIASMDVLKQVFTGAAIPPAPRGLPTACEARSVALLQRAIYERAMEQG